ncbi:hypothetical protein GPECTOR_94g649 [Gonium pectorale]|uniref:F-box domain-containing protein n=1 Tax=Gonium pectorale TaxID=33097 RepID=A0A150G0G7_GONPE|nr:hypothetical protein GPECTOR_94g649 [Gonium pectorale]|eukprot:KXZ43327.1 hypothetical protein GPECTOR_94g649 [Gonium pectorale]
MAETVIPTVASPEAPDAFGSISSDLMGHIFSFLDADTLVACVPLVCKRWRAEAVSATLWRDRLPAKAMEQLEPLASLGAPVSAGHLYLALRGRNFLRNPAFRRECNTQLLELGRPAWNKWKRDAWVMGKTSEPLAWEARAEGFTQGQGCGACAPPPPVPYGGGGLRLGARVQQQLRDLLLPRGGGKRTTAGSGGGNGNNSAVGVSGGIGGALGGWVTQQGPVAAAGPEAPTGPAPPCCIATAEDWCEVMQVVDLDWELQRRGLGAAQAAALLDAGLGLRLSVHVGSRADSLGGFCVGLVLDEGGGASGGGDVPNPQSFVMRPSRHCYFSGRLRCEAADRWQRFEYVVPSCPRGFRRALVLLRGRRAPSQPAPAEAQQLPPSCGAKFACAELVFE